MLDAIQQRVLGVLIEKELTVPDSYPLTENTLLSGCNQKSNRDPEMDLESRELHEALVAMREAGWVARIDGSSRSSKYRHCADSMLSLELGPKAVLCELLIRGPQAPGALKPRVARMGFSAQPEDILDILDALANRSGGAPLVEQQPKRPRERDCRWSHQLGPHESPTPASAPATAPATAPAPSTPDRLTLLEQQVATLQQEVAHLRTLLTE